MGLLAMHVNYVYKVTGTLRLNGVRYILNKLLGGNITYTQPHMHTQHMKTNSSEIVGMSTQLFWCSAVVLMKCHS